MRNSKKLFIVSVLLAILSSGLLIQTAHAIDIVDTAPITSELSGSTDPLNNPVPNNPVPVDNAPSQRDQTLNSSVTRAFLKGAGYTAPTSDMTCSTNAQGVETCVPSNDVRAYVVAIIKFVLTVIGFLFFALLFYAGYLWTTAGGNDESVKKAQGIASKAVIGLSIILAAWAITTFITSFLQKSVTP